MALFKKKKDAVVEDVKPATADAPGKAGKTPAVKKGQSLTAMLSPLLLGGILALVVSLGALWVLTLQPADSALREAEARSALNAVVASTNARLQALKQGVINWAKHPLVLDAMGSPEAQADVQTWIAASLEGAVRAVLFSPGSAARDFSEPVPVGFAALEMIRQVESGKPVEPEAFAVNDTWYVQYAAPVRKGDALAGVLIVFYDAGYLKPANVSGHVELLQKVDQALKAFVSVGKGQGPKITAALAHPLWRVRYQAPGAASGGVSWQGGLAGAAAGLVLLLGVWLLTVSRTEKRLHQELSELVNFVQARLSGQGSRAVPKVKTALVSDALTLIAQLFKAYAPAARQKASSRSGEQKTEASAPQTPAESQPAAEEEPLFPSLDDLEIDDALDGGDAGSPETRTQVQEDSMEIIEQERIEVPRSIFRAYDIRGIVGETLTEEGVRAIGRALGTEGRKRGVSSICVGWDGRESSPALAEALTQGLTQSGLDVIRVGQVPTPVLYFATHHLNTGSGVMVTGSHNPANYNGLKMMLAGETLAQEAIQDLWRRIEHHDFAEGQGSVTDMDVRSDYIDVIVNDIAVAAPLKVVVDAGNGVAGELGPRLIEELGCEVIPLYCDIDGRFPNHHPDPGKPENLRDLIEAVRTHQADLGIAFDGDGDRIGVVTNTGKIIYPDRLLMLFAKDVVSRNPGADVIFDVKCTRRLNTLISGYGGRPIMWKTGHSLIKAKMKETGALLAGEMSGHIFFKERWYGFDDGLYSAARLLEILGVEDRTSDEVFADFPEDVSTPEINVQVTEEAKFALIEALARQGDWGDGNVSTIDGIRVDYADGWGLVRASNTTPVLVLRFEADNEAALERIKTLFREKLHAVDPGLQLDF